MKKRSQSGSLDSTKKLALAALFSALCFILMYLGAAAVVFDLCAVTVSALVIIFAVIEIGGMYPWLIWAVSGTLCLLLLPDKYAALEFALYGGIYPILKALIEKLPRLLSWAVKICYFNAAFTLSAVIAKYIFGISDIGFELKIVSFALANVFFILSDICFTLLISSYYTKLRPRLRLGKRK